MAFTYLSDKTVITLVRCWCILVHLRLLLHAFRITGRWPDPVTPVTIEDKFLWRKIFDHNPLFVLACDKLASKNYAQSIVSDLKFARVIWSGTEPRKIPVEVLSGNVVVKSSQGCGWNHVIWNGQVDLPE